MFGSSDEVLGALETGVDFERRIADIYQSCRTAEEIDSAFDVLRSELEEQITARMDDTRQALLENFDEEVHRRLRVSFEGSRAHLDRLERCLWNLTRYELRNHARFDDKAFEFEISAEDAGLPGAQPGRYQFVTHMKGEDGRVPYRPNHPLAEALIEQAKERTLPPAKLTFDLSGHPGKIGLLEPLRGRSGWLSLTLLTVSSLESEDRLLFAGVDGTGAALLPEACEKLFLVDGRVTGETVLPAEAAEALDRQTQALHAETLTGISERNSRFFEEEIEKLDRWADDLKHGLEVELKDLDAQIKQARRDATAAADLAAKLALHRTVKELESERFRKRRQLFEAQDEIDARKEELIGATERRLQHNVASHGAFVFHWTFT